ncbi:hypothetical protein RSOLAG1IB_04972 [Rhizoctonia solani AG-1 IB]|uniref:Uncharacterized protein n=1 Tax=Thanatephorus cucumeris (strain AG1-IB / isolate 7/3/14) TaxID=1108050 RepID=A0A0B7FXH2_THACB|nr:hypothetical protein RSOLAG1IB_04972 [Rhizoctonia solani AG-1 IB]
MILLGARGVRMNNTYAKRSTSVSTPSDIWIHDFHARRLCYTSDAVIIHAHIAARALRMHYHCRSQQRRDIACLGACFRIEIPGWMNLFPAVAFDHARPDVDQYIRSTATSSHELTWVWL